MAHDGDEGAAKLEDTERSYVRIRGQLDWLRGQAGVDDRAIARAVAAALRGQPIDAAFPEGSKQNVVWRLAVLYGLRGPWLTTDFLVSAIVRLEQVAAGESNIAMGLDALWSLERERWHHQPSPLHARLRALIGPEVGDVEQLWASEAYALRPIIAGWQARVRSPEGGALLDEVTDAIADGISDSLAGASTSEDAIVARIKSMLPPGIFTLGYLGNPVGELLAKAWDELEPALRSAPGHAAALDLRAWLRLLRGDPLAEARADAEMAIAASPDSGFAYATLARIEQRAGRFDEAVLASSRAVEAKVPAEDSLALRAVCKSMAGDHEGAERDARAALASEPNGIAARYTLGEALVYQGKVEPALLAFEATLAVAPEHAATLLRRAELYAATGQLARALLDADRAVASSDARDAYYNRGTYRLQIEDLAGARADFSAAIERDPTDVQSLLNRGTVFAMAKDLRGAVDDWTRAAELAPTYSPARLKRGMGRLHLGELDQAIIDDLRAALRYAPPDWPSREEVTALVVRCEEQLGQSN